MLRLAHVLNFHYESKGGYLKRQNKCTVTGYFTAERAEQHTEEILNYFIHKMNIFGVTLHVTSNNNKHLRKKLIKNAR